MLTSVIAVAIIGTTTIKPCVRCGEVHNLCRTQPVKERREEVRRIVHVTASRSGTKAARHVRNGADREVMRIIEKESNFDPQAQNRRSSAFGLPQFLNSTWKSTGITKTDCPTCQVEALFRYLDNRYSGDPKKALNHHKKRGFY
jgi:hypothetical protein